MDKDGLGNVTRYNADNYTGFAYNILAKGSFSGATTKEENIEPSMRRAPGYPAFLATIFFISKQKVNLESCLLKKQLKNCGTLSFHRMMYQTLLFCLSGLTIYFQCLLFNKNKLHCFLITAVAVAILSKEIIATSNSEALAIPLYIFYCFFVSKWLISEENKTKNALISGLFLGLLTLTRAVYLYFLPVFIATFLVLYFSKNKYTKGNFKRLIFSFTIVILTISPWVARNFYHFGKMDIASSGAVKVLANRAEHNTMSGREYLSGFLYWAPIPILFCYK